MPRGKPSVEEGLGRAGAWVRGLAVSAQFPGCWAQCEMKVLWKQGRKRPAGPQCVAWGDPATGQPSLLDPEGCPLQRALSLL